MKKEAKKKKSVLMELPNPEEVIEKEEEEDITPPTNTEEDIFTVKPMLKEETALPIIPTPEPVKKKSLKSIRSPAQIESLKRGRELRLERIRLEKEKLGIVQTENPKIINTSPSQTIPAQSSPAPVQLPVNHKSNNDFESFLENYQKMKKFESFVLEKNARKQKSEPVPAQKTQPVQPQPQPQPQPQKLDYAFNLNRTSRRRGGFY